jgi:hypothetical protein
MAMVRLLLDNQGPNPREQDFSILRAVRSFDAAGLPTFEALLASAGVAVGAASLLFSAVMMFSNGIHTVVYCNGWSPKKGKHRPRPVLSIH